MADPLASPPVDLGARRNALITIRACQEELQRLDLAAVLAQPCSVEDRDLLRAALALRDHGSVSP